MMNGMAMMLVSMVMMATHGSEKLKEIMGQFTGDSIFHLGLDKSMSSMELRGCLFCSTKRIVALSKE